MDRRIIESYKEEIGNLKKQIELLEDKCKTYEEIIRKRGYKID